MEKESVYCQTCGVECIASGFTTGYGQDRDGNKYCFECCTKQDKAFMRENGKITLYLDTEARKVTNWTGNLSLPITGMSKGNHNIAGVRYDINFRFENKLWYGTQYGEFTQLCHCKQYANQ
jgi:hypothetical protein